MNEISKRILTGSILLSLLVMSFFNIFILIISLIFLLIIGWIEFNALISKIFNQKNFKNHFLKFLSKLFSLLYLFLFSGFIFEALSQVDINYKITMIYLFSICVCSDIGGFIFGKFFKGKKLTKISPNKTISGSIGSFILSLFMVPLFFFIPAFELLNLNDLLILALLVSLFCQFGDLFISYLKRKAKVKDTGDLLPGHGGVLDRIDGILLAIPVGMILVEFLIY
tara:strand:+ start:719 stop:1393 length:675 start_codon:yes stop_codon:yes gene_type:complete